MDDAIEFTEDEEPVLECICGGQGFLVLCSSDGDVIGFECLSCGKREYIGGN